MGRKFKIYLLLGIFGWLGSLGLLGKLNPVLAEDFKSDYTAEYWPIENSENLLTKVRITIKITNLKSDIYVKKINLSLPKSFTVKNITASDNKGSISPITKTRGERIDIELEFSNPNIGRDVINTFTVNFDQEKIFQVNGNIWEVILPTIDQQNRESYKVIFHLPETNRKTISIAKPEPDEITSNQIIWNNVTTKTIYAVLGDKQYYELNLTYHLTNPKIVPVYTDIALPPDTLYQKTYITSIEPKPNETNLDEDGNFLARYIIKPKNSYEVNYKGVVEISSKSREELKKYLLTSLESQKKYLLMTNKYWTVNSKYLTKLNSIQDIYNFTRDSLNYDYNRDLINSARMGADKALKNPNQAVCVEFSDTFIALSRKKGLYSREIQGFAFSRENVRPISLVSDILHSWPEYFDSKSKLWISVDPTWEKTSGIDYFNSFDLNHIVFAIHSKQPDYPMPAGTYKDNNTKDIIIKPISVKPTEKIELAIESSDLPISVSTNKKYKSKVVVKNNSNIYLLNIPLKISATNFNILSVNKNIPVIAPLQKQDINIEYEPYDFNIIKKGKISIEIMTNKMLEQNIEIIPYFYDLGIKIILGFLGILGFFGISLTILKKFGRIRRDESE